MEIESIANVQNQSLAQRAGLAEEDYLQVLLAQLSFQDPLEPVDNSEFISQFAELTNLTQTQTLNEKLDSLLTIQSVNQSLDLIGKTVEVTTSTANVVGEVTTVTFQNGSPTLVVNVADGDPLVGVTLSQIQVVRDES